MLKTEANPDGVPIEVFDEIRAAVAGDRSQFYEDLSLPFYGGNREGSTLSKGVRDAFWLMSMQAGLKNAYDNIKAFSETDFTEDLKRFDIPTLFIPARWGAHRPLPSSGRTERASSGMSTLALGLPQPVTGSQPGAAW